MASPQSETSSHEDPFEAIENIMLDLTEELTPGYANKIIGTNPNELGTIVSELMAEVEAKTPNNIQP